MKAGLKRIEATLHDLGTRSTNLTTDSGESKKRSFSFRISIKSPESLEGETVISQANKTTIDVNKDTISDCTRETILFPQHNSVQTFPAGQHGDKTPILPKLKTPSSATIVMELIQHSP